MAISKRASSISLTLAILVVGTASAQIYRGDLKMLGPNGEQIDRPDYVVVSSKVALTANQVDDIQTCDVSARAAAKSVRPSARHGLIVNSVRACAATKGIPAGTIQEVPPAPHIEPSCKPQSGGRTDTAKTIVSRILALARMGKAKDVANLIDPRAVSLDLTDGFDAVRTQPLEYLDPADIGLSGGQATVTEVGPNMATISITSKDGSGGMEHQLLVVKVNQGCITSVTGF